MRILIAGIAPLLKPYATLGICRFSPAHAIDRNLGSQHRGHDQIGNTLRRQQLNKICLRFRSPARAN